MASPTATDFTAGAMSDVLNHPSDAQSRGPTSSAASRSMWKRRNGAFFRLVEVHDQPGRPGRRSPEERVMVKGIRKPAVAHELERVALGELIHEHVRIAVEAAVHEELSAGAARGGPRLQHADPASDAVRLRGHVPPARIPVPPLCSVRAAAQARGTAARASGAGLAAFLPSRSPLTGSDTGVRILAERRARATSHSTRASQR